MVSNQAVVTTKVATCTGQMSQVMQVHPDRTKFSALTVVAVLYMLCVVGDDIHMAYRNKVRADETTGLLYQELYSVEIQDAVIH